MVPWKRAALFGFFSWLLPLVASFAVFPLKRTNAPLFETIMTLLVVLTAGVLFPLYFRQRPVSVREAVLAGAVWLVANLVLDYPLFSHGPMKMPPRAYYSEIGLDYLVYPLYAFGAARLVRSQK